MGVDGDRSRYLPICRNLKTALISLLLTLAPGLYRSDTNDSKVLCYNDIFRLSGMGTVTENFLAKSARTFFNSFS